MRWPRTPGFRGTHVCATAWPGRGNLPARRRGAGHRRQLNLSVAQLPFVADDGGWVCRGAGKPLRPEQAVAGAADGPAVDTAQPLSGVLVDEWTEVVPNARETTAITFQFDPPDAVAPQSVLLAVPPVPGVDGPRTRCARCWRRRSTWRSCARSIPRRWARPAQYLPALYLAFNAHDEAVSTDFAPLTR